MASKAKNLSLFLLLLLLLTLLSPLHTAHARDSQLFNKASTTTNDDIVPKTEQPTNNGQQQRQEPNFQPESENPYGLYPHGSATTEKPARKYLPKNYNPVAYVTQPDNINDDTSFTENNQLINSFNANPNGNYYINNDAQNYGNGQLEEDEEESGYRRNYPAKRNSYNNYYYNGGSSFNSPRRTRSRGGAYHGVQPQGMSDTRFLESGKYFYDVNTERYSSNHPYERLKGVNPEYNRKNFYGNDENSYELNSMGGYQNEFQDEDNSMLP